MIGRAFLPVLRRSALRCPSARHLSSASSGASAADPFGYTSLLPLPHNWQQADTELEMLPELAEARTSALRGNHQQAMTLLQRARDVAVSVGGETGTLTQATDRRLLALSDLAGNVRQGKLIVDRLLRALPECEDPANDAHTFERLLLMLSSCRLHVQDGNSKEAWRLAGEALGVSSGLESGNGALDSWNAQVADLSTIEVYAWNELLAGSKDLMDGYLLEEISKATDAVAAEAQTFAQHALVASSYGSAGAIACLALNKPDEAIELWEKGAEVRTVENDDDGSDDNNAKFMHSLFRCANFNNIAMVSLNQDQVTRADKALAEAMTLGQEIKPADPKSRQGVLHTVCFARTLRLLAKLMRKEEQAVSAEGLLRNAIDSLEAIPNGTSSDKLLRPTHAYELVHTWNDFANLLDEWDKRESEAEAYRTKAKTYAHVDAHLNRLQFTFNVNLGWSL